MQHAFILQQPCRFIESFIKTHIHLFEVTLSQIGFFMSVFIMRLYISASNILAQRFDVPEALESLHLALSVLLLIRIYQCIV